jgi:hypothetical protein
VHELVDARNGRVPLMPLARLQLRRALLAQGDRVGTRRSYEQFLAYWKNADPDPPVYPAGESRVRGPRPDLERVLRTRPRKNDLEREAEVEPGQRPRFS